MKIIQINTVYPQGSTGKIVKALANVSEEAGIENKIAVAFTKKKIQDSNVMPVSSCPDNHLHNRLARMFMLTGCFSFFHTLFWLNRVKKYNPDIIHIHNLHGNYINIPLLFRYIKKNNIPVVWTFHDCWPFTGYCPYFDYVGCNKWQTNCCHCPQKGMDNVNIIDNSRLMFDRKREWFSNVQNMTIVTPSQWLADLVKQSFLKNYPVKVINNGIDLNIFQPREPSSSLLENNAKLKEWMLANGRLNTENRVPSNLILGVAFDWGRRKGLDVFIELAKRLPNNYQIVLVGTDDNIDKLLPKNIISIHKTSNQQELAEIYSMADLFVNPTREEVFGMVNVEALACGTPVLTYNTGGSPECVDKTCGSIVDCNDINGLQAEIIKICEEKSFSKEDCIRRAKCFDEINNFAEYLLLYRGVLK